MKIRIVNTTGRSYDTKLFLILGNTQIEITECFKSTVITIEDHGEVRTELVVDRARLDIICNEAGFYPKG